MKSIISLQKEGWWEDVCESGFHSPELDVEIFLIVYIDFRTVFLNYKFLLFASMWKAARKCFPSFNRIIVSSLAQKGISIFFTLRSEIYFNGLNNVCSWFKAREELTKSKVNMT